MINVEIDNGASERGLFAAFYGEAPDWHTAGWKDLAAFINCVLTPLEWAGLISVHNVEGQATSERICFKTPLWRSALRLETDDLLQRASLH